MDGITIIKNLKKLREVSKIKDVEPLSNAIFPGYHCPLMGAMLTIKDIEDAVMMVIGPDECTYYTKMATGRIQNIDTYSEENYLPGNIVSLVLDSHDVTFGCKEKLEEAFKELVEELHTKTVFLVTTCIVEVIGDDIDSMAEILEEKYGFPIEVIHAENFKTDDHLPGIQDSILSCIKLMEKQECNGSVNILGQRLGEFTKTEVYDILNKCGVPKGVQLPGKCSLKDIKMAPSAKLNIVVHPIGLPLAKKMKNKFGIPYIVFERISNPENILKKYKELFQLLEISMPKEIQELYEKSKEKEIKVKNSMISATYFSGNTAFSTYEFHSYLVDLGLKPILIQTSEIPKEDNENLVNILEKSDPFVTRAANISPLKYIYDILKPDFSIGAGNSNYLRKHNIVPLSFNNSYNTLGFEVNNLVLDVISQGIENLKKIKGEK